MDVVLNHSFTCTDTILPFLQYPLMLLLLSTEQLVKFLLVVLRGELSLQQVLVTWSMFVLKSIQSAFTPPHSLVWCWSSSFHWTAPVSTAVM